MTKFWTHDCKEVGLTAIPHGEVCNWCVVTQDDVEQKILEKPITIDGEEYVT